MGSATRRAIILGILSALVFLLYTPLLDLLNTTEVSFPRMMQGNVCEAEKLCVAFLDVGQGDAIYIKSPTGVEVLIDGGRDNSVLRRLSETMGYFDRSIDMVIATHPDADHIGGLIDVLERYEVETLVRTTNVNDTPVADVFDGRASTENARLVDAFRGQTYELGGGAVLEILFPDSDATKMESNTSSIVARLTYGESSFLFTGDSPKNIEEYLVLTEGEYLESDVLKVGHHGSRTSTSELFLDEVSPSVAVIMAGKDNQYGHPHVEVTDLLFNNGVQIVNTAEEGTITFVTDGTTIEQK